MNQRVAALGYQQITSLSAATGLTLPVGAQQASGSACPVSGTLLTVGGTVTGAFAVGQIVKGTGVPANTYIVAPAGYAPSPTSSWVLSQSCTPGTVAVTGYAPTGVNFAVIRCEAQNVAWRDDGTDPTASIGMPMLTTDPPLEYGGPLTAIKFIQATSGAKLDVSYYELAGGS